MPALALLLAGCGTAVNSGASAALSGIDLKTMADHMAQSIAADPQVQEVLEHDGPMRIVVLPVENRLQGEVLPLGQARAFTAQVRHLLGQQRPEAFVWINNRDTFYALRARELAGLDGLDPGPSPDAIQPQFALHAVFTSQANVDKRGRSNFYVANFELTDIQDRTVLWSDVYNVKKTIRTNILD